jgi:hypothetical protein
VTSKFLLNTFGRVPDVTEDFAAELLLACLSIGHKSTARGDDGYADTAENLGHFGALPVDA